MNTRRFPPPWRADKIPGGYVVRDANGQALAYLYSPENEAVRTSRGGRCSHRRFVNCSPAVDTNAAIAMKRASARSPGSSEMTKATAVPVWA